MAKLLLIATLLSCCLEIFGSKTTTLPSVSPTFSMANAELNIIPSVTTETTISVLRESTSQTTTPRGLCGGQTNKTSWNPDASIFNLSSTGKGLTGLDRRSLGIIIFGYVCFLCVVLLFGATGVLVVVCRDGRKYRRRAERRQGYQTLE
jgi:hypothetical protein